MDAATKTSVDLARIREVIVPVLVAYGVELADAEWVTERSGWTLRVTIERLGAADLSGGVTLEDCAEVSRDVSAALDVADLISAAYNLEVSSPGLDRRLKSPAEFRRFLGRTAKVKLSRPAPDGQRLLRGEILEAPEGHVAMMVDGKRIEASLADVVEARLVFELTPQPKAGKKGKRRSSGQHEEAAPDARPAAPGPQKRT
ncbi:ribosome maturation factor RimP [Chondromyces apiculatus]|nr:ribosome maturation factor RimP [Chondromyces apiculatus]